ncbi:MAG: acetyl-CoA acetyltransferase [Acidobacteriota bacterium]|nr:acetyl-CoA acetyltransferase [Acidobacteriota bacterium]
MDEDRTPVLVAWGQCTERDRPMSALALMARAAESCLSGAPGLARAVEQVSVVHVLSPVPAAPAAALARRLGLAPQRTEVSTIGGNSPQWLVNRAAADVAAGRLSAALVAGAEVQRSAKLGLEAGVEPEDEGLEPDPVVGDDRAGVGRAELDAGLIAPVHVYALFESVLAHRAGRDPAAQRLALGALMAPFTAVAAAQPAAWFPTPRTPEELAELGPDNRLVAEPYPKRMCAVLGVDQAAAVLVTSLGVARRAKVDEGAVFCLSGAEANDVWFPTARPDPGTSPAIAAAGRAALEAAGTGVDDVAAFDLYSCFPCAVQMAADALGLGLDDARGFTVTGGLPYFGGPGNDYTLHAIATMAERLRRTGGTGLVTGLGWYATKHAVGLYGTAPPPRGWRPGDTAAAQAAIDAGAVEIASDALGAATVVAGTVVAGRDGAPTAAPVIARLPDGRQIAAAAEEDQLGSLAGQDLVGRRITLTGPLPRFRLAG